MARIIFEFSSEAAALLFSLSSKNKSSTEEVLRNALALYVYVINNIGPDEDLAFSNPFGVTKLIKIPGRTSPHETVE